MNVGGSLSIVDKARQRAHRLSLGQQRPLNPYPCLLTLEETSGIAQRSDMDLELNSTSVAIIAAEEYIYRS